MVNSPSRSKRGRPRKWPRIVSESGVTVRIYRRKTPSGNWGFLVANHSGGKRRLDSYATEAEALAAAGRVARYIATGNAIVAEMTRTQAAEYADAVQTLAPFDLSLPVVASTVAEAVKLTGSLPTVLEAARLYAARRCPVEEKTVDETVEALLAARADRSDRYKSDLACRLRRFADCFRVNVSAVTAPQIQAWLDGLKLSARSQRNFRSAVLTLFAFAERRGFIAKGQNPAVDTEPVPARVGRIHILKPEQMERLLNAASTETLPVLVLCGYCGMRTAEALRLRWEKVDFAQRHVIVGAEESKTASRRIVPLPDNALEWLRPYVGRAGPVWPRSAHSFIPKRVIEAKAAGVRWRSNVLRHSAISYRVALTGDVPRVALESGNSPAMVFSNYRELVKPADAHRWFAIRPARAAENVVALPAAANT